MNNMGPSVWISLAFLAGFILGAFFISILSIKYPRIFYENVWFIVGAEHMPKISEMFAHVPNLTLNEIPDNRKDSPKRAYLRICLTGWFNFEMGCAQNYKHKMLDLLRKEGIEVFNGGVN